MCTKAVNEIVKAAAARGGFDPAKFGGHSLRAGFVTDGISAGVSDGDLMAQTGHTNPKTLHRYNRGATDPNRARKMRDMLRVAFGKEKSDRSR
jgi:integrase